MLRATSKWRLLALIAPLAAIVAAAAFFLSSSFSTPERVLGIGDIDLTGINCTDIYRDPDADTPKGGAPDDDDFLVGMNLGRIEPIQPAEPNKWTIESVQYLGPDLVPNDEDPQFDIEPDKSSAIESCAESRASGRAGAENGEMNPHQGAFQHQGGDRPGAVATYNPATKELTYASCVLLGAWWMRTDVNIVISQTGPNAVNYGQAILYIPTGSPDAEDPPGTAVDPYSCDITGALAFPSVLVWHTRDATTDHPDLAKNIAAAIPEDPDGPHPKVKGDPQDHDGTGENPTFLADDWDGDGCPDWDELDKDFINGIDPFNPYDCDMNFNSTFHTAVEVVRNSTKCTLTDLLLGTCIGNGAYFQCTADISHDKTGGDQEPLSTRISCYTNNPAVVVNVHDAGDVSCPPADPEYCGNGVPSYYPKDVPPPYTAMQPGTTHTELSGAGNYYDTLLNEIHVEGCFEDVKGVLGPLVYVRAVIDAHNGQGTIDVWTGQTDCNPPGGAPSIDDAAMNVTEVKSKNPRKDEPSGPDGKLPLTLQYDSDGDWCSDTAELTDNQQEGGLRDPANGWDYMNPTQDGQNRVDDILATVNQYFIDDNDANPGEPPYEPGYNVDTDRTSIVGANPWNLGPPNGQQRVDDILASVKSYFHDCGPSHVGS